MKSSLVFIITGIVLGLALLMHALSIDIVAGGLLLFATGIVAWTLAQYHQHHSN